MLRVAEVRLSVDPSSVHVVTDGAGDPVLVVDSAGLLLEVPLTVEGLGVVADTILGWLAANDHAFSVEVGPAVVGHIDDTPSPVPSRAEVLESVAELPVVQFPADVRAELADTVRRGVLNVEYRLTPPGVARFQSREDHEDAIGARLNNADGPDAA